MSLPNFIVYELKITFDSCISGFGIDEPSLRQIHFPLIFLQLGYHLIEPWCFGNRGSFDERSVRGGNFSDLILDNGEHFSDGEVDAPREFILVIDLEPSVQDLDHLRFQDLDNWKVDKLLVFQNGKVFLGLGTFTKCFAVGSLCCNFSEVSPGICILTSCQLDVTCSSSVGVLWLLEALSPFEVNYRLYDIKTLIDSQKQC